MGLLFIIGLWFKLLMWEFILVLRFFYIIGKGGRVVEFKFEFIEGWLNGEVICIIYVYFLIKFINIMIIVYEIFCLFC